MKLYGKGLEERNITGSESLRELLGAFRERKARIVPETLPKMDRHFLQETRGYQKSLQETMKKILREIPFDSQQQDINKALDYLVSEYVCSEFGLKYDEISGELFALKRVIPYRVNGKDYSVSIPLFAFSGFRGNKDWEFNDSVTIGTDYNKTEHKVHITSKQPPVTSEAKERARIASADYMEIYSRALREPVVGNLLLKTNTGNLNMWIGWIPTPSELNIDVEVIDRDPILIGNTFNRNYLIAKWDIEGELPYEHYLREFSEGKLKIYED